MSPRGNLSVTHLCGDKNLAVLPLSAANIKTLYDALKNSNEIRVDVDESSMKKTQQKEREQEYSTAKTEKAY